MIKQICSLVAIVALLSLNSQCLWSQATEKKVKDQAEFDLITAANTEKDAAKKLQSLNTWKDNYPESDWKQERLEALIQTYQQLNQGEGMWKSAQELLAANPKSTPGLFWSTWLIDKLNNTAPDRLNAGEMAARGLLQNLPTQFAADKKPAGVSDADWNRQREKFELDAIKAIGWIEMSRKSHDKAESEFVRGLKMNPDAADVSQLLGHVLIAQGKIDKQIQGLYHWARASSLAGDWALPDPAKKQLLAHVQKTYTNFHGTDPEGFKQLVDLALKSPFPPDGFTIEDKDTIQARKDKEFAEKNPELATWLLVKAQLSGANGPAYFESDVKGVALKLKGKVISQTPARRPKEVVVSVTGADPEIRLVFETPLATKADVGAEIQFEGAGAAFSPSPFLLTLEVEKAKLIGWPAAPTTMKKAGAAKK